MIFDPKDFWKVHFATFYDFDIQKYAFWLTLDFGFDDFLYKPSKLDDIFAFWFCHVSLQYGFYPVFKI